MRFAYADPPYIGRSARLYGDHPDYAGEVDHGELVARLMADYPDGWALSCSSTSLRHLLALCPGSVRVLAWVKRAPQPMPGIRIAYAWEPVILQGGRETADPRRLDWIDARPPGQTARPVQPGHVIGRKPREFCFWLFDCLGAEPGDELADLFPGSGAVSEAWDRWSNQLRLA